MSLTDEQRRSVKRVIATTAGWQLQYDLRKLAELVIELDNELKGAPRCDRYSVAISEIEEIHFCKEDEAKIAINLVKELRNCKKELNIAQKLIERNRYER